VGGVPQDSGKMAHQQLGKDEKQRNSSKRTRLEALDRDSLDVDHAVSTRIVLARATGRVFNT
jgi:hypothetical protein